MHAGRILVAAVFLASAASARDYELITPGPTNASSTIATRMVAMAPDASRVVFTTQDPLTAQDVDAVLDVYEWADGVVTLLTPSTLFPVTWKGASANASRVAFETSEAIGQDSDGNLDVYVSDGGAVQNVSGGTETLPARYRGMSASGTRVWFVTDEALAETQVLVDQDVYEWQAGVVTLISTGPGDEGYQDADWAGATPDGSHVYFITTEKLCAFLDAEFSFDAFLDAAAIYERIGETTNCPGHTSERTLFGSFLGVAATGNRMVFTSDMDLDGDVVFGENYLYAATGESSVSRVSVDTTGNPFIGSPLLEHISTDASRVTFSIAVGGVVEIFQQGAGVGSTELSVGEGQFEPFSAEFVAATPDGSHVVFQTRESLLPSDVDESVDVYEWQDGELRQVSIGPFGGQGAFDAQAIAISADGRNVVFATNETLVAGEAAVRDLFGRINATDTVLLTPTTQQLYGFEFAGLSSDGRELILRTRNPLSIADDEFGKEDLYRTTIEEVPEPSALALTLSALLALRLSRRRHVHASHDSGCPVDSTTAIQRSSPVSTCLR